MEDIIETTRSILAPLIRKPKMSNKLLGRPPFRFIHDIIFNLSAATGFPDLSIFDESEMVGKAIKSRDAKIAFLEKAIAEVERVSGEQVTMRPSKAVAGQESDTVNEFLQLVGRLATDAATGAGPGAAGDEDGKGPEDLGGGKEAEADVAAQLEAARQAEERQRADEQRRMEQQRQAEAAQRAQAEADAAAAAAAAEREAAERQAAAAAAAAASKEAEADVGGKEEGGADDPFAGSMFVNDDIDRTAAMLSSLISKPRMSHKLLGRPPYRFIHDIVTRLGGKTGFAEGLLDGDELNPKTKDRDVKLSVLGKLINMVGIHLGIHVRAQAAKVAAGKETDATNELLQYVGYAATRGGSTADAVSRVLAGETQDDANGGGDVGGNNAADAAEAEAAAAAARAQQQRQEDERRRQQQAAAEQEARERQRRDAAAAAAAADAARQAEEEQRKAKEAAAAAASYGGSLMGNGAGGAGAGAGDGSGPTTVTGPPGGVRRLARPTTARRRPPRVRDNAQQVEAEKKPVMAVGIMKEGEESDSDDEPPAAGEPETKTEDVFGNGAAAGGAGKLTRDILDQQRAAESKNKANAAQQEQPRSTGIRMGRIKKSRGTAGSYSQVDIEKLRSFIQKLCQSTNPLGKCMDYVLEDIESMKGELGAWKADYRRRCQELETEKELTRDEIVPLQQELKAADMRIEDEIAKINTVKAKIAKNDARTQELLRMVVSW